jgi:hypothetical protein
MTLVTVHRRPRGKGQAPQGRAEPNRRQAPHRRRPPAPTAARKRTMTKPQKNLDLDPRDPRMRRIPRAKHLGSATGCPW